jgi:hypothetical protein
MKQTYTGGCHCGAVRYEADMDLSKGTLKCNCSMCTKARAWMVIGIASEDFRLLQGEEALSDYQFGRKIVHHLFCRHCGIKSFARGNGPGGRPLVAIVLTCIDSISDADLASLPVMHVDGRNDNFSAAPVETRHL